MSDKERAEWLVDRLRKGESVEQYYSDCEELCELAGMAKEYIAEKDDTAARRIVEKAAGKFGLSVLGGAV